MMAHQPSNFRGHSTRPAASLAPGQTSRGFHFFQNLPAEIRIGVWKEAIQSTCTRILEFQEEARVFLEEDSGSDDANRDSRERVRFLLKPGHNLAETTRSLRNLARVCHEARYEVLKGCLMMTIGGVQLLFNPAGDIVCIRPRCFRQPWPIYTTKEQSTKLVGPVGRQNASHAGLLRNVRPLPRSVQHLAIDCRSCITELDSQDLFDLMGFLTFGSEARSLSLLHRGNPGDGRRVGFEDFLRRASFCNVDRYQLQYLLHMVEEIACQDISTAEDWTEMWSVSGDLLRKRWHRLKETEIRVQAYPPAGSQGRRR